MGLGRQSLKETLENSAVSVSSILGGLLSYLPEAGISWSKNELVFAYPQPYLTHEQESMPALRERKLCWCQFSLVCGHR